MHASEREPLLIPIAPDDDDERRRRARRTTSRMFKPVFALGVIGAVVVACGRGQTRGVGGRANGVVRELVHGRGRGGVEETTRTTSRMAMDDMGVMDESTTGLGASDPFIIDGVNRATPDDGVGTTEYHGIIAGRDDVVQNTREGVDEIEKGDSRDVTFTLLTACAARGTLTFPVGTWEGVGARVTTKSMSEDFIFDVSKEMQQVSCGTYRTSLRIAPAEQFGFYLYPFNDANNDVATVSDIGCVREGDKRCPGFASPSALAEMKTCAKEYEYGENIFYNRIWDGEQTTFVFGSCDLACTSEAPVECPGLQPDELPTREHDDNDNDEDERARNKKQ